MTDPSGDKQLYHAIAACLPHLRVSSFSTPLGKEDTNAFSLYSAVEGLVSQATHASWFPLHGWEAKKKTTLCFLQDTGVLNTALMFVSRSAAEGRTAAGTNAASWLWMVAMLVAGGGTVTSTSSPKAPPKLPVPSVHCRGTASGRDWSDKASEEKRGQCLFIWIACHSCCNTAARLQRTVCHTHGS